MKNMTLPPSNLATVSPHKQVKEITSQIMHKYYCENDVESVIAQMDEDVVWFGAADHEFAFGFDTVSGIFRKFSGKVPKCNITDEKYHVLQIQSDAYLCTGQMWIETDVSTMISLRVHQRISAIFRWREKRFRCCHIHISNPYDDMDKVDIGFPTKMAKQSYQYMQEQIEKQKLLLAEQTAMLQRMSYEDSLTGLFNRNKFNQVLNETIIQEGKGVGIACIDLNGLKEVNDKKGHSAGDRLICSAAEQIQSVFEGKSYRIGGDEFGVIVLDIEKALFLSLISQMRNRMIDNGISCSIGNSWRTENCDLKEQFDEADHDMYQEKKEYYCMSEHNRRKK